METRGLFVFGGAFCKKVRYDFCRMPKNTPIETVSKKSTERKTTKLAAIKPPIASVIVPTAKPGIALKTIRSIAIGLSLIVIGFGAGYQFKSGQASNFGGIIPLSRPDKANLDFSQFWDVWNRLESSYVDSNKIDYTKMVQGAIKGMTEAIGDPYTLYLPPQDNKQSKEDLDGQFDGVGISLGYIKGTVGVQSPLEDGPAIKAGVRAGDVITHIKDEVANVDIDTTGMTLQDAVHYIRGKKGTAITLTFYREEKGSFEKSIVRDTIIMPSVEVEIGDWKEDKWEKSDTGSVAWLKVTRFGDNTQEQWDNAVRAIQSKRSSLKGVVLDLRNNPGGLLQEAINLASEFIPEGVIVKQQGKITTQDYTVNRQGKLLGIKLNILINGGSASASEILAGALRDRVGAVLIGEKSFGKGTVQEAVDLKGGAGLHVTIAKWLLPNGDWIHEKGLTPAIEVKLPETATDAATAVDTQLQQAVGELKK